MPCARRTWDATLSRGSSLDCPGVRCVLLVLAAALALAGCGGNSTASSRTSLTIVVNAPFSRSPYLGRTIENGARLAAREVNANGVRIGATTYELDVRTMDTALSPARAVANMRRAVGQHTIAVVD